MHKKKNPVFVAVLVLIITMACMINIGGPDYPKIKIPVSTEEVINMQEQIREALLGGTESSQITLFFTESQLTSYLAFKLDSQDKPFLTEPQVYLQNNQIQVYGTIIREYLKATVSIFMTATIDPDGKLLLELSSADFGPLPVPENLKEIITSLVTEAFTGSLGTVATGFNIESIVIANSAMMIVGRLK